MAFPNLGPPLDPEFNFIPVRIWSAAFNIWAYLDAITISLEHQEIGEIPIE